MGVITKIIWKDCGKTGVLQYNEACVHNRCLKCDVNSVNGSAQLTHFGAKTGLGWYHLCFFADVITPCETGYNYFIFCWKKFTWMLINYTMSKIV